MLSPKHERRCHLLAAGKPQGEPKGREEWRKRRRRESKEEKEECHREGEGETEKKRDRRGFAVPGFAPPLPGPRHTALPDPCPKAQV